MLLRIGNQHPHCKLQSPPPDDGNQMPVCIEQAGSQILVSVGNAAIRVLQIAVSRTEVVSPRPKQHQQRRLLSLRDHGVYDASVAVSSSLMPALTPHRERIEKHEVSRVPSANVVHDVLFAVERITAVPIGKHAALDVRGILSETGKYLAENVSRIRRHLVKLDKVFFRRSGESVSIHDSRSSVPAEAGRVDRPDSQRQL